MTFRLAVGLAGLLTASVALADDCSAQLPGWLEQAHPGQAGGIWLQDERGAYRVDARQSICKVWPARPHLTLVAVPLLREEHDDHGQSDLEVLLLDSARQDVVARLIEPNRLDWDAIFVDGIEFDTAPYRLRAQDLAFGVRIKRRNGSAPNPFHETELNLYELDGQQLRSVLSELVVQRSGGEWDTHCAGEFSESTGVVIITERVGHVGYRDLQLRMSAIHSRSAEVAGDCQTVERSTQRSRYTIEYGDERYLLPIELSPL
ncbi:hypothetical protein [Pseudomonas sp. BMW13]|uniref:hypothetical protein n=1 Tax=Pseudomonas sp. BMW13 TaxID=2562590 RepID=UPI001583C286|nr:hypothetical protein [Pseudomonas sp. BMW13]